MKLAKSSRMLLLAVSAFAVGGMIQPVQARDSNSSQSVFASSAADGARLYIKRSPVLAYNISISIMIDGQIAGTLVRARTFDHYIKPGRHVLVASPNRLRGDWSGVIDLQAGKSYAYIASYNVDRLRLDPIKSIR
jgi:hypothetical protein